MVVAQEEVCWCGPNTFGTCANFTGRARLKKGEYCLACTEGRSTLNATLCEHWRLVKPRNSNSKQVKAKQLSAEAADVRGQEPQTPSGEVRVGNYDEDKIRSDWAGTIGKVFWESEDFTPVAELTCCCGVERGKVCLLQSIASVCLLLRHFIHVTDNFCHLFCPFSQVVPWDFLSALSSDLSPLYPPCSDFSLLSPSSSPLTCLRWDPLVYPPCSV